MYQVSKVGENWIVSNGTLEIKAKDLDGVKQALDLFDALDSKIPRVTEMIKKHLGPEASAKISRRETIETVLKGKSLTVREIVEVIGGVKKEDEKFYASICSVLSKRKVLKRKKNAEGIYVYSLK